MKSEGDEAEAAALSFLLKQRLTLKARNFRSRFGEIDLIMDDAGTLVFVEVRKRSTARYGGAAASITARKQAKLRATAQFYLTRLDHVPPCRFDALLVDGNGEFEWIRGAFEA